MAGDQRQIDMDRHVLATVALQGILAGSHFDAIKAQVRTSGDTSPKALHDALATEAILMVNAIYRANSRIKTAD